MKKLTATKPVLSVCSYLRAWGPGLIEVGTDQLVRPTLSLLASDETGALNGALTNYWPSDEQAADWLMAYFRQHGPPQELLLANASLQALLGQRLPGTVVRLETRTPMQERQFDAMRTHMQEHIAHSVVTMVGEFKATRIFQSAERFFSGLASGDTRVLRYETGSQDYGVVPVSFVQHRGFLLYRSAEAAAKSGPPLAYFGNRVPEHVHWLDLNFMDFLNPAAAGGRYPGFQWKDGRMDRCRLKDMVWLVEHLPTLGANSDKCRLTRTEFKSPPSKWMSDLESFFDLPADVPVAAMF